MKVLLPVDGSDYTKRILRHIAAHDELRGGATVPALHGGGPRHSALADVILGSVGNGVLARCKLPMLLVAERRVLTWRARTPALSVRPST